MVIMTQVYYNYHNHHHHHHNNTLTLYVDPHGNHQVYYTEGSGQGKPMLGKQAEILSLV